MLGYKDICILWCFEQGFKTLKKILLKRVDGRADGRGRKNNRRGFKNGLSRNDHNITDVRASLLKTAYKEKCQTKKYRKCRSVACVEDQSLK